MKKKIYYGKLVRNNIPSIISKNGGECQTKILDRDDYRVQLKNKLIEETAEWLKARKSNEILDETADILEVLISYAKTDGYSFQDILDTLNKKGREKGGFDRKIYLITATEPD